MFYGLAPSFTICLLDASLCRLGCLLLLMRLTIWNIVKYTIINFLINITLKQQYYKSTLYFTRWRKKQISYSLHAIYNVLIYSFFTLIKKSSLSKLDNCFKKALKLRLVYSLGLMALVRHIVSIISAARTLFTSDLAWCGCQPSSSGSSH